jgi:hypothetical protein
VESGDGKERSSPAGKGVLQVRSDESEVSAMMVEGREGLGVEDGDWRRWRRGAGGKTRARSRSGMAVAWVRIRGEEGG